MPHQPSGDSAAAADGRKPLTWLGCGCALMVGTVLSFVVLGSLATWRASKRYQEGREDPAAAIASTREVVPWDQLPAGYHPTGAMDMPFGLLEMAVFADSAPYLDPAPELTRAFFFVEMPDWMDRKEKLARVFRGEEEPPGGIVQVEVQFESREELTRGALSAAGGNVLYYARRGDLEIEDASFGLAPKDTAARREPGIATMLLFDCAGADRLRIGLWFATDPEATDPEATSTPEADLTGTPADPAAIADFLSHFAPCD